VAGESTPGSRRVVQASTFCLADGDDRRVGSDAVRTGVPDPAEVTQKLWGIPPMNWLAAAITACGFFGGFLTLVDAGQASIDAVAGVLTGAVLLGFSWVARRPIVVAHAS